MKARHWSLAIILLLVNYLIFAALFTRLLEIDFNGDIATRTPIATFTPAPAQPFIIVPTLTPPVVPPTPTPTRVIGREAKAPPQIEDANSEPSNVETLRAEVTAPGAVNIRSGPGTNYDILGTLNANTALPIVGRNGDATWWQIQVTESQQGWVANSVVNARNTAEVPLAEAPPPPVSSLPEAQPAASNPPAAPPPPKYQFSPTGWYDDGNAGLTQFLGDIKDANGGPVDGVFVRASCGDYSTISYPSGPTGWGTLNESADWPRGFYDIVIDERPIPCIWILSVVETDDRQNVTAVLSEEIPVEVTNEKSIIVAGWQKNW